MTLDVSVRSAAAKRILVSETETPMVASSSASSFLTAAGPSSA